MKFQNPVKISSQKIFLRKRSASFWISLEKMHEFLASIDRVPAHCESHGISKPIFSVVENHGIPLFFVKSLKIMEKLQLVHKNILKDIFWFLIFILQAPLHAAEQSGSVGHCQTSDTARLCLTVSVPRHSYLTSWNFLFFAEKLMEFSNNNNNNGRIYIPPNLRQT